MLYFNLLKRMFEFERSLSIIIKVSIYNITKWLYEITHCITAIDPCLFNPCVHGSCSNLGNDYMCTCHTGYIGKDCDMTGHGEYMII